MENKDYLIDGKSVTYPNMNTMKINEENKDKLQNVINDFEVKVRIIIDKVNDYFEDLSKVVRKIAQDYKPFFEKYGYDIKYMNTIIYKAKYAKKKRVRNKYRNMLKNTLGQEFVNNLIKNDNI